MNRNDYVHALVGFFDVEFSRCHTRTGFSTGPLDDYTHWKQTVFYLDNELVVSKGEVITGSIKVNRNSKNPRDLDVLIKTEFKGKDSQQSQERFYRLR